MKNKVQFITNKKQLYIYIIGLRQKLKLESLSTSIILYIRCNKINLNELLVYFLKKYSKIEWI